MEENKYTETDLRIKSMEIVTKLHDWSFEDDDDMIEMAEKILVFLKGES